MKKIIANKGRVLLILVGLLTMFALSMRVYTPYAKWKKARMALEFPDNIETGYWVGTLKIKDPIVAKIHGEYYILPKSTLQTYDGCDSAFLERADVIHAFSTEYYMISKYTDRFLHNERSLDETEAYIHHDTSYMGLPIYEFYYPPKDFKLALIRKYKWVCTEYPDVFESLFLKDYQMVLVPCFTAKQRKKMQSQYHPMQIQ